MDSLVLVLIVIGAVLILAGVARMRAKPHRSWDEVDHRVLFTDEAPKQQGSKPVVVDDSLHAAPAAPSQKEPAVAVINRKVSVTPEPVAESTSKEKEATRSLFGRLRTEREKKPEAEESPLSVYRDGAPNWIIAINIVAPTGLHFTGPGVVGAVQDAGMRIGDMNIFHYKKGDVPLFSLVNGVKPGVFDLRTIDSMTTPCLSLFIQVPNQNGNSLETFDLMLTTARKIADKLGGDVRDEARNVLTKSAIDFQRQKIAEYDLKWQAA
ncbi:MAG: cell division protein ZipA [Gammaproteobacteria bacterium]|nr:cell division protein ZipA [Gammaproteobacteria bacterium]